jgi:hypothetical protein
MKSKYNVSLLGWTAVILPCYSFPSFVSQHVTIMYKTRVEICKSPFLECKRIHIYITLCEQRRSVCLENLSLTVRTVNMVSVL